MKLAFTKQYTDVANALVDQLKESINEGFRTSREALVSDAAIMLEMDESELDHSWDYVCEAE